MNILRRTLLASFLLAALLAVGLRPGTPPGPDAERPHPAAPEEQPRNSALTRPAPSRDASAADAAARTKIASLAPLIAAVPAGGDTRFVLRDGPLNAHFNARGIGFALVDPATRKGWGVQWGLAGARPVEPEVLTTSEAAISSFSGPQETWRSQTQAATALRYRDVLPGVEMRVQSRPRGVHYELSVAPGSDASRLRFRYEGATSVEVSPKGDSVQITAGTSILRESGLQVWQDTHTGRVDVEATYRADGSDGVAIALGAYDPSLALQVDPVIGWTSFLGGAHQPHPLYQIQEMAQTVAYDAAGNIIVTGYSAASDFPGIGETTAYGFYNNLFVTKINAAGTALLWSTVLGQVSYDPALALDAAGNIFLSGTTQYGFPQVLPLLPRGGGSDAFVAKLSPQGAVVWSSYLGGSGSDSAYGLAVDSAGDVIVVGSTDSANFPLRAAFQPLKPGAFVTKIAGDGTTLRWSTFLGGSQGALARGVDVDASNNVIVGGSTSSGDFPIVGGFRSTPAGPEAFVCKFPPDGSRLLWSTFLGGSSLEEITGLAVNTQGEPCVTGWTYSSDFPAIGAGARVFSGVKDAFVARLSANGSTLAWSTCLGGGAVDEARSIALDGSDGVFVTGFTSSADFPLQGGLGTPWAGVENAFVARYGSAGALSWASLLTGSNWQKGWGIAATLSGEAVVVGQTASADFPVTPGAYDTTLGADTDGFIVRFNADGTTLAWGTFLGGQSKPADDSARAVALDADGNIYVAGETWALDFPATPGAFDAVGAQKDAFVSKIAASGSAILWSSYLGGSLDDSAWTIALDASRRVYVGGDTYSSDFPLQAPLRAAGASGEGFLAKIAANGRSLLWSTFVGGSGSEILRALAVDSNGNAYVGGHTTSADFPATGFDKTFAGASEAYVTKINAAGTKIVWSTFLGGSGGETTQALAVDASFNVYAAGLTGSADFPVKNGFGPAYHGGSTDGFLSKLAANGGSLVWSSLIGGSNSDAISALKVDAAKNTYLAGTTKSPDFVATLNLAPPRNGNSADMFVMKVPPAGDRVEWSALVGGGWDETATGLALDAAGNVFVTGTTHSGDFPLAGAPYGRTGQDAYVVKIAAAGDKLHWSMALGGWGWDEANAIAIDGQGRAIVTGFTSSGDFQGPRGFDSSPIASGDAFITRIDRTSPPSVSITGPTSWDSITVFTPSLTVSGSAGDDDGILSVSWRNETTNQSGLASGITLWSFPVALVLGANRITVTATDGNGFTATDVLTVTRAAPKDVTLIPRQSEWAYADQGTPPGYNWPYGVIPVTPRGPGPLGYGFPGLGTTISQGPDPDNRPMTAYFSRPFYLGNGYPLRKLTLKVRYDDGFAAFLDGNLVASGNMPEGYPNPLTPALGDRAEDGLYQSFDLPLSTLNGTHWLAIEVHQDSTSSTDLIFDAELTAQIDIVADTRTPVISMPIPNPPPVVGGVYPVVLYPQVSDDFILSRVEILVDGVAVSVRDSAFTFNEPFSWDTRTVPNGPHAITVVATDDAGNVTTSLPAVYLTNNEVLASQILLPKQSVWKYRDNGIDPGYDWVLPEFNDSTWRTGPAPLGYGEPYIATKVRFGPDPLNRRLTTLFRKDFDYPVGLPLRQIKIRVLYDDGFSLQINGGTVFSSNADAEYGTPAYSDREAGLVYEEFILEPWQWQPQIGRNVVAVDVHQSGPTSNDLAFDMEIEVLYLSDDTTPPTVSIVTPAPLQEVSGLVSLRADAADDRGLWKVEFFVDGLSLGTDYQAPYELLWSSIPYLPGEHVFTARATDLWNFQTTSAPVTVRVSNP